MSIALQLNTDLVTIPEKKKIKLQTDDSYWAEEKRIYACYETIEKDKKIEVIVSLAEDIFAGAGKGAIGGFVGGALVSGPAFGAVGSIFGGLPGFVVGYKIGVVLSTAGETIEGGLRGFKEFKIQFMTSDKYKQWVEEARKTDVYPVYQKIIEGDARFDDFICPLKMDLICVPVRAPDGKTYEQANISEWIKKKENQLKEATNAGYSTEKINSIKETLSPIRANVNSFSVDDLRYQLDYFTQLDKIAKVKISEMNNAEEKRIFKSAIDAILMGHISDRKQIIKEQMFEVQRYVRKHKLDPSISEKVTEKLMQELDRIEELEEKNKKQ